MEYNYKYAICISNDGCDDLEERKIYQCIPDEATETEGYLRIVDESGEDYIYSKSHFLLTEFPENVEKVLCELFSFGEFKDNCRNNRLLVVNR